MTTATSSMAAEPNHWFLWVTSPGFAGSAAVLAAIIAGVIAYQVSKRERAQREREARKAQWWQRAQWALDLTFSSSSDVRETGYNVLDALGDSEWAGEHEFDIIDAATRRSLTQDEVSTPGRWYSRLGIRRPS